MSEHKLDKTYDPKAIETKWYSEWETSNAFKAQGRGEPFCLMIPPPNVTGSLHMGHAFEATIMDTLTRFNRMKGNNTLWQVGTDHAGIATQMVVERKLLQNNQTRLEIGREAFVNSVWQWKEESGNNITQQLRRMAASVDWTRERFTMDDDLSAAVKEVFIKLYNEGLIYRGKRLVNWDPKLHTAISDLEVVNEEEQGHLWTIAYKVVDSDEVLQVATTRPETLFGDMAVAVNPNDSRYQNLIGKQVHLPLTDRTIPVISDDYVDIEFGTGCLKITPAHDFNDYEVGQRHNLEPLNIFTIDAVLNENVPERFQGLERNDARKQVLEELDKLGLLIESKPHTHKVPRGDRSGVILEPYLTNQWYVKIAPLAEPAIDAVKNKDIQFIPQNWENTYFAWMENIQDWCISRQLWWGHRIPAWYNESGKIFVGESEQAVREKHNIPDDVKLTQDEDVLDTWFSSALWPFSTLGWPKKTNDFKTFYPTNVLVTGFDIIFFWVARMIMFGLKFTGQVPFREVYIHGLICDGDGKKMSKSKGNVLDPIDIIDGIDLESLLAKRTQGLMQPQMAKKIIKKTKQEFPEGIEGYGTDALRFTFSSLASTGRNIQFDFNRLTGYRNFCNKLWNAARYILMHISESDSDLGDEAFAYSQADRWIQSKLQTTIESVTHQLETYRFDLAANEMYNFVWHEFCDWYLELSKPVLTNQNAKAAEIRGTKKTLSDVFECILRLLHPVIPYITEEIWQKIVPLTDRHNTDTIALAKFPVKETHFIDNTAENNIEWLKSLITVIRNIRGEMNISPAKPITLLLRNCSEDDISRLNSLKSLLYSLGKIEKIEMLSASEKVPTAASAMIGDMEIKIPLAGLINLDDEKRRLNKELQKIQADLSRSLKKLENPNYIKKAPVNIVTQEKSRVSEGQKLVAKIEQQLQQLNEI